MNLQQRIDLVKRLGEYILSSDNQWSAANEGFRENGWFTPEFVDLAANSIGHAYLNPAALTAWAHQYQIPDAENPQSEERGHHDGRQYPPGRVSMTCCAFSSAATAKPSS